MSKDPFLIERDDDYKSGIMIGGYVPRSYAEYLRLLSLYNYTTTQTTLKDIIGYWMESQEPRQSIIHTLADRAYQSWKNRKKENPAENYNSYKKEIKDRLRKRKLSERTIYEIITAMNAIKKVDYEENKAK